MRDSQRGDLSSRTDNVVSLRDIYNHCVPCGKETRFSFQGYFMGIEEVLLYRCSECGDLRRDDNCQEQTDQPTTPTTIKSSAA